eukprot:gene3543-4686_t
MSQWAKAVGLSYGSEFNHRDYPAAWDAFGWHQCMCSAQTSAGFTGNPAFPAVGP